MWSSCELLSKIIIFVTRHNWKLFPNFQWMVVNCFQKLLSSWHDTTPILIHCPKTWLWIAFKNYYLRDTTQQFLKFDSAVPCCELLSKIIIFVTRHNSFSFTVVISVVVNCFQKLLSSWHDTTFFISPLLPIVLWIAFKNYYLRDTTQLSIFFDRLIQSCELLSKIIIFVTRHNAVLIITASILVVNCFQKLLSSWHDTTWKKLCCLCFQLWIAFKNYYLRDTTQPFKFIDQHLPGCELLSKIIIFVTRHNNIIINNHR